MHQLARSSASGIAPALRGGAMFPLKGLSSVSYAQLVAGVFEVGYAGALGWAVTDDAQGPWAATKADVKAFADAQGCAVRR